MTTPEWLYSMEHSVLCKVVKVDLSCEIPNELG